ncbi:hypothetical protein BS47DRAFT_1365690 [Hydnum rufescens UP504]|uniref:Uncharacterized protein n=1 Tax=Hydnum rufescens UP504 TaxID=1448309 RepID=A0A9P6AMZ6_9AGAM|nr:hypothetical protein BS47DRAFT_1365690 [Hydnum rufescens UP504]
MQKEQHTLLLLHGLSFFFFSLLSSELRTHDPNEQTQENNNLPAKRDPQMAMTQVLDKPHTRFSRQATQALSACPLNMMINEINEIVYHTPAAAGCRKAPKEQQELLFCTTHPLPRVSPRYMKPHLQDEKEMCAVTHNPIQEPMTVGQNKYHTPPKWLCGTTRSSQNDDPPQRGPMTRPNDPPNGELLNLTPPQWPLMSQPNPRSSNGKHHTPLRAYSCAIDTTQHPSKQKMRLLNKYCPHLAQGHFQPIFGHFANAGPGDCGHNENPQMNKGPNGNIPKGNTMDSNMPKGDVTNSNAPDKNQMCPMSGPIYGAPGAPGLLDWPPRLNCRGPWGPLGLISS